MGCALVALFCLAACGQAPTPSAERAGAAWVGASPLVSSTSSLPPTPATPAPTVAPTTTMAPTTTVAPTPTAPPTPPTPPSTTPPASATAIAARPAVASAISPCDAAVAYIAANGAPGWSTVCGLDAGYDIAGCVAGAHVFGGQLPFGCTDPATHTSYIACPIFVVYANEAENQRYLSGLGGRVDAYGEAPQCAYANPLGG